MTAITDIKEIISYHFQDSLRLADAVDLASIQMLADVGTGAGFPGIPLKLKYPDLQVILIEVTRKKINFLEMVINTLGLEGIQVFPFDWRTFIRSTEYPVDLICARASLQLDELFRMFKPTCPYNQATLVYWATQGWQPLEQERRYLQKIVPYTVGKKARKLVLFAQKPD